MNLQLNASISQAVTVKAQNGIFHALIKICLVTLDLTLARSVAAVAAAAAITTKLYFSKVKNEMIFAFIKCRPLAMISHETMLQ